ncbi:MAG TPA: YkgJ family cysteine cluster protein [Candidatus Obscuribacterales bacterium]
MDLHIPEGIRFQCTGCANCCYGWPVPATQADFDRITALLPQFQEDMGKGALTPSIGSHSLFREFKQQSSSKLGAFKHTLEKRSDGKCEFLMSDNRCWLHHKFGAEAKPAMCQLFPYTFTETPSGTYVSVSFAASGVLFNAGQLLTEQRPMLMSTFELFKRLFPNLTLDWSTCQLIDGVPLSWTDYLEIESPILNKLHLTLSAHALSAQALADSSRQPAASVEPSRTQAISGRPQPTSTAFPSEPARRYARTDRLLKEEARLIAQRLDRSMNLNELAKVEARPKIVDQLVLKYFAEAYFPEDVYANNACDLDTEAFIKQLVNPPEKIPLVITGKKLSAQELMQYHLGDLAEECEDLITRFIYCRLFSKLYFAAGLGGLSLIAAIHHLVLIIALLRISLKARYKDEDTKGKDISFVEVAESLRAIERRLTVTNFSDKSRAIIEVLLSSPERMERILSLAA